MKRDYSDNVPQTLEEDFLVTDFRATEQALDTLALEICCRPLWKRVWQRIQRVLIKPRALRPEDINYFPPINERMRYARLTDEKDFEQTNITDEKD